MRRARDARAIGLHVLPAYRLAGHSASRPEHKRLGRHARCGLGDGDRFVEMPKTSPATTTRQALVEKLSLARGRSWVDHAFFMGAAAENADLLGELETLPGCAGVKIFLGSSTGSLLVDDPEVLRRALRSGRRRVAIHAEHEGRLKQRRALLDVPEVHVRMHPGGATPRPRA